MKQKTLAIKFGLTRKGLFRDIPQKATYQDVLNIALQEYVTKMAYPQPTKWSLIPNDLYFVRFGMLIEDLNQRYPNDDHLHNFATRLILDTSKAHKRQKAVLELEEKLKTMVYSAFFSRMRYIPASLGKRIIRYLLPPVEETLLKHTFQLFERIHGIPPDQLLLPRYHLREFTKYLHSRSEGSSRKGLLSSLFQTGHSKIETILAAREAIACIEKHGYLTKECFEKTPPLQKGRLGKIALSARKDIHSDRPESATNRTTEKPNP